MDHTRFVYNLNQLWVQIERRLFLDDWFVQVSKFKMMKLTSIVLGRVVNNAVEIVVNPPLIPYGICNMVLFIVLAFAQKYQSGNPIPTEEKVI